MNATEILIADDHEIVRRGIRALLESEPDLKVVGETGDGLETVEAMRRLQPDILVLDLMLPGMTGLQVLRRLAEWNIASGIIVFTMYSNEAYAVEALKYGARAYVIKNADTDELIAAIRNVLDGRRYLSPPLSESEVETFAAETEGQSDRFQMLTPREKQVLRRLVADGSTNANTALQLNLSVRTIEVYRGRLMRKLNLKNQAELMRFAVQRGIVTL